MKNIKDLRDEVKNREVPKLSDQLDSLEERLPKAPANIIKLNRAIASRAMTSAERIGGAVADSVGEVTHAANTGAKTVIGTARRVAKTTASAATTGARQVSGQVKAQTSRTASAAHDEVVDLTETAIENVEASDRQSANRHYRSMTKAELYELAQERDIDGRSNMSKRQLVAALTAGD